MDRSKCRISEEEYKKIVKACGYKSLDGYQMFYLSGMEDSISSVRSYCDKEYDLLVTSLLQAEKANLIKAAIEL